MAISEVLNLCPVSSSTKWLWYQIWCARQHTKPVSRPEQGRHRMSSPMSAEEQIWGWGKKLIPKEDVLLYSPVFCGHKKQTNKQTNKQGPVPSGKNMTKQLATNSPVAPKVLPAIATGIRYHWDPFIKYGARWQEVLASGINSQITGPTKG
jgi:hypothetical protein